MKTIVLILMLTFITLSVYSQNIIYLKNNTSLEVAKMKCKSGTIEYKLDKTEKYFSKINLQEVQYFSLYGKYYGITKNGFTKIAPYQLSNEMIKMGTLDACYYYTKYNAASNGTFFTTFLAGGLLGLIPAIATSSTTPKEKNLNIPDGPFRENPQYIGSYKSQAKNIKSKSVWKGFGIGIASAIFVTLMFGGISH